MAASTITRDTWTNDSGTAANPNLDGTIINNAALQNNIYARIDAMFAGTGAYATLTLGGILAAEGFGTHTFSAGGTGANIVAVRNTTAGTGNYSGLWAGNNSSSSRSTIQMHSTTFTPVNDVFADGMRISCVGVGGLALSAANASGIIRLFTGATPTERMRISEGGLFGIGGTTSASAIVRITGTYTPTGSSTGLLIDPTITANVDTDAYIVNISGGTINEAASGTHPRLIGVRVAPPTIGAGAATLSETSTVYISDAPSGGTTNYALHVEAGETRLDGRVWIGYNSDTFNTKLTLGLTITQTTNDDEILTFKSDDIGHGITTLTDTQTYGSFKKVAATTGGLEIQGFSASLHGVYCFGIATTADTGKATTASAPFMVDSRLKSGTSAGALGANANIAAFQDNAVTRFIFDAEGSGHADVEWIAFDSHDDVALLDTLNTTFNARDAVTNAFGDVLRYSKDTLQQAGIVNFYDDGPRAMVNFTRLAMLHTGALRQLARRQQRLEARLLTLEA